jgi:ABC-type dipeptide/oligopeptide/nickel transport system ATPase component
MQLNKVLEQHIAVFGESGSGKTVLVSSFYGATQEPDFLKSSLFDVTADNTGQGHRLHRNYLGMRDSALLPEPTRFAATPYAFTVKLKDKGVATKGPEPFDALRLVWHDYPGEWFEQDVSGPEEAQRRLDTFKSLLGSDVAFLLVDGQRLLDNAGEEERYLRSLIGSYRTGLLSLKSQILDDGKPLVRFPRIWVMALSKADLLPELDVFGFRNLIISKAADDLDELRKVLAGLVVAPSALAVGEDYVRLSSARFEPNRIEVTDRIGLDLILPMAAMLPFERHIKWADRQQMPAKVAAELLDGVGTIALLLISKTSKFERFMKLLEPLGIGRDEVNAAMKLAAQLSGEQLRKLNADAAARRDYLAAVMTRFQLDLEDGEEARVLLRSKK